MFHTENNLFFGRMPDGSVRILKFNSPPADFPKAVGEYPDAVFDVVVSKNTWASVIASVSAAGEHNGRWYQALEWHDVVPRL